LAIADEAVALARRLGDEPALLEVWTAAHLSGSVAHRIQDPRAEHPDLLALAERVGDPYSLMLASAWGIMQSLELADVEHTDRLLARLSQVADEVSTPVLQWVAAAYRCCRLMVSASGDEIEQAAIASFEIGQESGQVDALVWFAGQVYQARMAQGRMGEILDLCRQQRADNPGLPAWASALAVALLRAGELEEAKATLDEILACGGDPFPYDRIWLLGQGFLGETLASLGTPEQAARQYEVLRPYAGRTPCVGTLVRSSVTHELATLAARAGWPDVAERHFAEAEAQHAALDAPIWLARTRLEWGRFLLGSEPDRALPLLQSARELADRMGAVDVRDAAAELLASV
jgi:tetratricopeptide (TPR) repeat protein